MQNARLGRQRALAPVDGSAFYLVLVQPLVQVQALEQELDHRRAHLRAVRQRKPLQGGAQLRQVADRSRVGPSRDSLADLEHGPILKTLDETVEVSCREVPAENSADRTAH